MNLILLVTGCVTAGFLTGLLVAYFLFRRRAGGLAQILRRYSRRKYSMRAAPRFKLSRRPAYRPNLRNFRFNPRNNRDW